MNERRERQEARRRRAFAGGIAVSVALHAAALAFVQFRVDFLGVRPAESVRILPLVHEQQPPPEPADPPEPKLIRIRQTERSLAAGAPEPAEPERETAAMPELVVQPVAGQGGAAAPLASDAPRAGTGPAVLMLDVPDRGTGVRVDGLAARDPGGVPLYEPGSIWRVKSGWLTTAGLDPRGAAVSVWVVGCPAPRTIVSSDPTPTFRGRPCH